MGAAFQIEPKMNTILQGSKQRPPGKTFRNPEDAEQEEQQSREYQPQFPAQILIHC